MNQLQKQEILELIEQEKTRLGSYSAVARKCKVSEATISQLRKGVYAAEGDDIYNTIAIALGYEFNATAWNIAPTTNFRMVSTILSDAKNESMWMGISHKAGAGKTASANIFLRENKQNCVFKIDCKEWSGRTFLTELAREIGAELDKGYSTIAQCIDTISESIKKMGSKKPLIILDQANSLKPSALRTLIHLFNQTEDVLGLVVLGTENIEYEIKRGVRLNRTGYDEIDSRFGRIYGHLIGANLADTRRICEANGITDKDLQTRIFAECDKVKVSLDNGSRMEVIEDMRRLKRVIKRELLSIKNNG